SFHELDRDLRTRLSSRRSERRCRFVLEPESQIHSTRPEGSHSDFAAQQMNRLPPSCECLIQADCPALTDRSALRNQNRSPRTQCCCSPYCLDRETAGKLLSCHRLANAATPV